LNRELNADDVTQLADHISRVRVERFFDNRIQRISQINQLDSLLVALGVLEKSSATSATVINDNFFFTNFVINRFAGSRFSFGVSTSANLFQDREKNFSVLDFENKQGTFGWGGYANYRWELPVNLYWQHSISTGASINKFNTRNYSKPNIIFSDPLEAGLNFNYSLGFYPNTRTYLNAGLSFNAIAGNLTEEGLSFDEKVDYLGEFVLGSYYYFSPRLRFSASFKFGNEGDYPGLNSFGGTFIQNDILKFGSSLFIGFSYAFL